VSKKTRRGEPIERQKAPSRSGPRRVQHRRGQNTRLRWAAAVVAIVLVVGAFAYYARGTSSGGVAVAATADLGPLTAGKPAGAAGNFRHVSTPWRQGTKPVLMFIGAAWCPFCAAERWPIVKALARFGTWSGLTVGQSTDGKGGFGVIPSYDFLHATYTSSYVTFDGKEIADNSGATLQSLSADEQAVMDRYDSAGSIPMVYADGYVMLGAGYVPTEIQGQAFSALQGQLQHSNAATSIDHINAETNLLTALLCKADAQQPSTVCANATITTIERGLQ